MQISNFTDLVQRIQAALPVPPPVPVANEIITLQAELNILLRQAAYMPPQAPKAPGLYDALQTALYRYMPPPAAYPWAKQISIIVTGG